MSCHGGNVGRALAERGGANLQHIETVVEVLAEKSVAYGGLKVHVGGSQDPDVDTDGLRAANPLYLLFLEKTQQVGLQLQRQVADFIKQQGAAIRRLDPPGLALVGTGKGAFFMAEQFGLDQLFGYRSAVHRNKGLLPAWRLLMQGMGNQLLARAAFSANHDWRVG